MLTVLLTGLHRGTFPEADDDRTLFDTPFTTFVHIYSLTFV